MAHLGGRLTNMRKASGLIQTIKKLSMIMNAFKLLGEIGRKVRSLAIFSAV